MKVIKIYLSCLLLSMALLNLSCSQEINSKTNIPKESSSAKTRIALAVSDLSIGTHRLAFGIIEAGIGPIKNDEIKLETFFLQDENNPLLKETLVAEFQKWPVGNKGVYTSMATFDRAGKWGIGITYETPNGLIERASTVIDVAEKSLAPFVGDKAYPSRNITNVITNNLYELTTDPTPYSPFYEYSIEKTITERMSSLILFASPAFCTTGTCGPQIDIIKNLHSDFSKEVVFIHVEIYENPADITGDISNASVVQAVKDWNLPSEPWVFLVDEDGIVRQRFEGLATYQEIKSALTQNNFITGK